MDTDIRIVWHSSPGFFGECKTKITMTKRVQSGHKTGKISSPGLFGE